ncbi:hypothetical protein NHF40_02050 [Maricaulaceae bacterium EIL42A08]|nr:hypothetical protein [Maricaulaceae bacterium EIL42A08]
MKNYSMQALSPLSPIDKVSLPYRLGRTRFDDHSLDGFATALFQSLKRHGYPLESNVEQFRQIFSDFFQSYVPGIPETLINNVGSTNHQGLLPLWITAHELAPTHVIESGVFIGGSLRMFRNALPSARIDAYDISFGPLRYHDDSIIYSESEWSLSPPELEDPDRTLVFFDDHISAARRIQEARSLNIRWIVFDDNPSVGTMSKYRYPSIPSLPLILDEDLPDGARLQWHHAPTKTSVEYTHSAEDCRAARNCIASAVNLGAAFSAIGSECGDKWLVELHRDQLAEPVTG